MAKDPYAKFNLGNIRSGSRFRSGSGLEQRGIGWKGALHDMQKTSRSIEFANLTKKDIELGSKVIENEMKHKASPYSGLNYHELKDIHHKLEELKRSGKLSASDEKDFDTIAQRLKG